jgi:hypothetical protein
MRIGEVRQFFQLQAEGQSLMRAAMSQLQLSAHTHYRILKLVQTIADLSGIKDIRSVHLEQALQYHPKSMMGKCKSCRLHHICLTDYFPGLYHTQYILSIFEHHFEQSKSVLSLSAVSIFVIPILEGSFTY